MTFGRFMCAAAGAWLVLAGAAVRADVSLPRVFGSHMVLQREAPIPVWGHAAAGEEVTVELAGKTARAVAGADGAWRVDLPALPAGGPFTMTVKAANTIVFEDVLVGEVWIGSGQSNMQWSVGASDNAQAEIAAADFPEIRLFSVPLAPAPEPRDDVDASWKACTPETVPGFSAVLFFFGRELHKELGVPFGLVNTSWGGTLIEPWTPPEGFELVPELADLRDRVRLATPATEVHKAKLGEALDATEAWLAQARAALTAEEVPPPLPAFPGEVLPVTSRDPSHQQPTALYNSMVHPLIPYGIRGAIWYQGESNRGDGFFYVHKMRALIEGWRTLWDRGPFPFYFVQLAPYRYGNSPEKLAEIQSAQQMALAIPNTGMAVTNDIGNVSDIHPRNKQEVGRRLSLWALAKTYGKDVPVYSGPLYREMTVEGAAIRLRFDHAGSGLAARDGEALTRFEIIGRRSEEWVPARAAIDGKELLVSADGVTEPVAVRFAWNEEAEPNLMNREGLPAGPFLAGTPPVFVNHALNKPYECSDTNAHGDAWKQGLTDGSWGTDALHCFATNEGAAFPKHVTVDLGASTSLSRVVFGVPPFGSTRTVRIELSSDGTEFREVGSAEFALRTEARETIRFPAIDARYVRLTYVANHTEKVNYDANFGFTTELEAYGPNE